MLGGLVLVKQAPFVAKPTGIYTFAKVGKNAISPTGSNWNQWNEEITMKYSDLDMHKI